MHAVFREGRAIRERGGCKQCLLSLSGFDYEYLHRFWLPIFTRRFFCSALSAFCSACVLTSAFALIIIPGSVFFCSAILLSDFAQTTPVGSAFFFFLFFSVVPVPGNKTQRFQNCAKHFFLIIFLYFFTLFITHKTHGGWWYMWR